MEPLWRRHWPKTAEAMREQIETAKELVQEIERVKQAAKEAESKELAKQDPFAGFDEGREEAIDRRFKAEQDAERERLQAAKEAARRSQSV